MFLAREFRALFLILAVAAIVAKVYLGWLAAGLMLLLLLPLAWIFRDPAVTIPSSPLAVVSPAGGRVLEVREVEDEWLKRPAILIRIGMSLTDIHILRSPVEGKIRNQWATRCLEPGINRRYTYWIQTDEGDDVVLSVAAGYFSPYTRVTLRCGERTGQGLKCGFMYFNGTVDVLVPVTVRLDLKPGMQIEAGASVLAQLIHNEPVRLTGT